MCCVCYVSDVWYVMWCVCVWCVVRCVCLVLCVVDVLCAMVSVDCFVWSGLCVKKSIEINIFCEFSEHLHFSKLPSFLRMSF